MTDGQTGTNPRVRGLRFELLSDSWAILRRASFEWRQPDGTWTHELREAYDRGNGATILLHDPARRTVLLTRQFRLPAFVTGYRIRNLRRLFELFMSPGSVTERVAFYVAEYDHSTRTGAGGGLLHEGESIEVVELDLEQAIGLAQTGGIVDGKTVILLQWASANLVG